MLIKQPRFSVLLRRKQLTEWPGERVVRCRRHLY